MLQREEVAAAFKAMPGDDYSLRVPHGSASRHTEEPDALVSALSHTDVLGAFTAASRGLSA